MNLIGFNGKMGVGKSTAIQCLKRELEGTNTQVHLVKFAQPLYDIQEFVYNRISSVHKRQEDFTKDRKLLQWLGTDWGRDTISQTLWIDIWKAEVNVLNKLYPNDIIICDDVRFDNEAETIYSLNGSVVKITSHETEKRIDTKTGICNHASEAGIWNQYIDYEIENNGSISDFNNKLTRMYKEFGILPNNQRSK
jgi:DNA polymerase III delta prime subunit